MLAQSNPFISARQAGLLSSDRFSPDQDAWILQPDLLPDVTGIYTSANIQSRFSGFGVYALGLHLAGSLPGNFGTGLSLRSMGNPDYKTTHITLKAGKKLGLKWGIGVSQTIQRSKVGSESRPWSGNSTVTAGFNSDTWGIALRMAGLMAWNQPEHQASFTSQLAAFVKWPTRTQMFFLIAYQQEKFSPVIGLRQTVLDQVFIFGAFQLSPVRYGIGFDFPLTDRMRSVISTEYHPVLGWSPALGISMMFINP